MVPNNLHIASRDFFFVAAYVFVHTFEIEHNTLLHSSPYQIVIPNLELTIALTAASTTHFVNIANRFDGMTCSD